MAQPPQIKEEQKITWNRVSASWLKWNDILMRFLQPVTDEFIQALSPATNARILDVASGTGEPAFSIAQKIPEGLVLLSDLSEEMLAICNSRASAKNISNIETAAGDLCDLRFEPDLFDAISCRFGFMFFPDLNKAAAEMHRILKQGGCIAVSVWDIPENNFWVTAMMGTIQKILQLQPPPSGIPGIFRCCKPGMMQEILEQAGFKNYHEKKLQLELQCSSADEYWNLMTETGASVAEALQLASPGKIQEIKNQVRALVQSQCPGKSLYLPASCIVIKAEK